MGAQEAVALLTGQKGKRSSHACLFVPTYPDDDRIRILKKNRELQKLPSTSVDITQPGIKKRFASRSPSYHSLTYSEFAAWTELRPGKSKMVSFAAAEAALPCNNDEGEDDLLLRPPRSQSESDTDDDDHHDPYQPHNSPSSGQPSTTVTANITPTATPPSAQATATPTPPPSRSPSPIHPTTAGKRKRPTGLDDTDDDVPGDPMATDSPPTTAAVSSQAPYNPPWDGNGRMEDMPFDSSHWDQKQYVPFLGNDYSPDWFQPTFIPCHVRAMLASPLCPDEARAQIGNGPAFGTTLGFDHRSAHDPRNFGKPEKDWFLLDEWAERRYNRFHDGPRPPHPVEKECTHSIRLSPRILRSEPFDIPTDEEGYFRQLLVLHTRWNNEDDILGGCATAKMRYLQLKPTIDRRSRVFNAMSYEDFGAAHVKASEFLRFDEADEGEDAAELKKAMQDEEGREWEDRDDTYDFDLDKRGANKLIMEGRGGALPGWSVTESHMLLSDEAFYHLVASLNERQAAVFYSVTKIIKDCPPGRPHQPNTPRVHVPGAKEERQLIQFISGGAGSGKSCLLTAIRQAAVRHYRKVVPPEDISQEDISKQCPFLLLMAYTGAAAFNVHGETLHGGMHVGGRGEGGTWKRDFSASHVNKMRASYKHLKFLMIDEASMLSNHCLASIDALFRQTLDHTRPFGGLHVLFFGDLFQLQPSPTSTSSRGSLTRRKNSSPHRHGRTCPCSS